MSFLGLAYGSRLKNCTGNGNIKRIVATYSPPIWLICASMVGATVAEAALDIPELYIAMFGFGIVALLFLVVQELIPEAHEAHADDFKWWISINVFVSIYFVLILDNTVFVNLE